MDLAAVGLGLDAEIGDRPECVFDIEKRAPGPGRLHREFGDVFSSVRLPLARFTIGGASY